MSNINTKAGYAPAEAERGKFFPLDDTFLSSLGYPTSGDPRGKYAILTYNVSPTEVSVSTDGIDLGNMILQDGVTDTTLLSILNLTNSNPMATAIVDANGSQITTFDVNVTDTIMLDRLGPVTALTAIAIGNGISTDVSGYSNHTLHVTASGASVGMTIDIESSLNNTIWAVISSLTLTTSGTTEVAINDSAYKYIRASCSAHTAGTVGVELYSGN